MNFVLFEGLEDYTSNKNEEATHNLEDDASPPKKRGKHVPDYLDLGLPEQRTETQDQWKETFQFRHYTSEPPKEVYQGMATKCKDELKAVKQAYNRAAIFFNEELGKLPPCSDTSTVLDTINGQLGVVRTHILTAEEILPSFLPNVETYLKFRDGPLLQLKQLEDQYYKKLEELAEMPMVDKLVAVLMCEVKSDDIEKCSDLTMGHIHGIIHVLQRKFKYYSVYSVVGANKMDADEFHQSEMQQVVNENTDLIKSINSSWGDYERTEAIASEDGWKLEVSIIDSVHRLVNCLKAADLVLRVMGEESELLRTKDVIHRGYDDDFEEDWFQMVHNHKLTPNFYL